MTSFAPNMDDRGRVKVASQATDIFCGNLVKVLDLLVEGIGDANVDDPSNAVRIVGLHASNEVYHDSLVLCAGLVMTGALQLLARRRRRVGTIVNIRTGEIHRSGGFAIDDQRTDNAERD